MVMLLSAAAAATATGLVLLSVVAAAVAPIHRFTDFITCALQLARPSFLHLPNSNDWLLYFHHKC